MQCAELPTLSGGDVMQEIGQDMRRNDVAKYNKRYRQKKKNELIQLKKENVLMKAEIIELKNELKMLKEQIHVWNYEPIHYYMDKILTTRDKCFDYCIVVIQWSLE